MFCLGYMVRENLHQLTEPWLRLFHNGQLNLHAIPYIDVQLKYFLGYHAHELSIEITNLITKYIQNLNEERKKNVLFFCGKNHSRYEENYTEGGGAKLLYARFSEYFIPPKKNTFGYYTIRTDKNDVLHG